jgi:hypothetical protein
VAAGRQWRWKWSSSGAVLELVEGEGRVVGGAVWSGMLYPFIGAGGGRGEAVVDRVEEEEWLPLNVSHYRAWGRRGSRDKEGN